VDSANDVARGDDNPSTITVATVDGDHIFPSVSQAARVLSLFRPGKKSPRRRIEMISTDSRAMPPDTRRHWRFSRLPTPAMLPASPSDSGYLVCIGVLEEVAARAYWKGYLKLSLVSCPIALVPATSSTERVSFRQINRKTGNRLRQQLVDDVTRELIDAEDRGRGYELAKGVYLPVEDAEIDALQIESKHTIDIDSFVPGDQIDKRYYDSGYYVTPTEAVGQEAFALIRDAMRGKGMVGLGRVVLNKRERVVALEPHGKGILATTLRYRYEIRKAEEHFEDVADVNIPAETLKLAEHILDSKAADFDPSKFEDRYETALVELLTKKQAGFTPPKGKEAVAPPRNVINLMDALRASIAADQKKPKAEAKRSRAANAKKRA
jgi:DNA end-binding protein Ku